MGRHPAPDRVDPADPIVAHGAGIGGKAVVLGKAAQILLTFGHFVLVGRLAEGTLGGRIIQTGQPWPRSTGPGRPTLLRCRAALALCPTVPGSAAGHGSTQPRLTPAIFGRTALINSTPIRRRATRARLASIPGTPTKLVHGPTILGYTSFGVRRSALDLTRARAGNGRASLFGGLAANRWMTPGHRSASPSSAQQSRATRSNTPPLARPTGVAVGSSLPRSSALRCCAPWSRRTASPLAAPCVPRRTTASSRSTAPRRRPPRAGFVPRHACGAGLSTHPRVLQRNDLRAAHSEPAAESQETRPLSEEQPSGHSFSIQGSALGRDNKDLR